MTQQQSIIEKTREFASENRALSWYHLLSSVVFVVGLHACAILASPLWLKACFGVAAGLMQLRLFIVYHDHLHGALLAKSRIARGILSLYGLLVIAPPSIWKHAHNRHHAKNMLPEAAHIGSFPVYTIEQWQGMTLKQRWMYRALRHPLCLLLGALTIFGVGHGIRPLLSKKTRRWDTMLALPLHLAVASSFWALFGWQVMLLAWVLPYFVSAMCGAVLFYVQHNFPGMRIFNRRTWTFVGAAMESTSFFKLPRILHFVTGNIGYHHIHHVNHLIPFYRLPEAMAAIPELQSPKTMTLHPRDLWIAGTHHLWDERNQEMVTYREAARRVARRVIITQTAPSDRKLKSPKVATSVVGDESAAA